MRKGVWAAILVATLATGYVLGYFVKTPGGRGMAVAGVRNAPPVKAFAEGQTVYFIHTEASDPKVAELLTKMMDSPVLVVPALAGMPEPALAPVYVFANGLKGGGPFGFQPDVFSSPPGNDGYRPLRAVHLVKWKNEPSARELKSVAEIKAAEAAGEVTIERPGVVVNMPMLTWPGGKR